MKSLHLSEVIEVFNVQGPVSVLRYFHCHTWVWTKLRGWVEDGTILGRGTLRVLNDGQRRQLWVDLGEWHPSRKLRLMRGTMGTWAFFVNPGAPGWTATIGIKIQLIREDMEADIQEFSELVGVPIATLADIEEGVLDDPPMSVVFRVCKALGISFAMLLSPYTDKIERSVVDRP